jgi:hypothetical protein
VTTGAILSPINNAQLPFGPEARRGRMRGNVVFCWHVNLPQLRFQTVEHLNRRIEIVVAHDFKAPDPIDA